MIYFGASLPWEYKAVWALLPRGIGWRHFRCQNPRRLSTHGHFPWGQIRVVSSLGSKYIQLPFSIWPDSFKECGLDAWFVLYDRLESSIGPCLTVGNGLGGRCNGAADRFWVHLQIYKRLYTYENSRHNHRIVYDRHHNFGSMVYYRFSWSNMEVMVTVRTWLESENATPPWLSVAPGALHCLLCPSWSENCCYRYIDQMRPIRYTVWEDCLSCGNDLTSKHEKWTRGQSLNPYLDSHFVSRPVSIVP